MQIQDRHGFTLLELLLVIATFGVLAAITTPVAQIFQVRNDINISANTVVQTIRRAQILSSAVDGDQAWGVYIATSTVTLFQGTSFVSRDTDFDEELDIFSVASVSGLSEIIFDKFSGETTTTGTSTLTSTTGYTWEIHINEKGMVTY